MSLARKDENVAYTAGFPNAGVEATDTPLDLNDLVIRNRTSTFYMRVDGDQWSDMNIHSGDVLIVDRSLAMRSGDMVVAQVDGTLIIRNYRQRGQRHYLFDSRGNDDQITGDIDFQLWGVITYSFHKQRSDM